MNAITTIRPASDDQGLRSIADIIRPIVADISLGAPADRPRTYWADGCFIRTANGRVLTVAQARRSIVGWQELSIDTINGRAGHAPDEAAILITENMRCIGELLAAIAEVEANDPTPPAANAMAVPQQAAA